jgi:phage I-like protein
MDVSSLTVSLPDGDGVPEWLHLLPSGTFSDTSGKSYHLKNAAGVIAATRQRGKIALDENHSTQRATASGAASPARAWISEYQIRDDGIWGKPDWNPSGIALMTDKSYKNISPVYRYDKDGNVLYLISAALTNDPGLLQLTALHSHNGNNMEKDAICTALGIAPTVADAEVLTALQTAVKASSDNATALQTAQAEVTRLTGELTTLKTTSVPMSKVVELETNLTTLQTSIAKEKAIAFVDSAIKAGKPIGASRDNFIALHTADAAGTEAMVGKMPSINAAGAGGRHIALQDAAGAGDDTVEMTAADMAVCSKMGISKETFMKNKKAMMATSEGSAA